MKIFIIIVSLVVSFLLIILLFFGIPYRVPTKSMEPTIKDGDIVFIGKNPFFLPKIGDIVGTKCAKTRNSMWIRRVIGIPGDVIYWGDDGVFIYSKSAELNHLKYIKKTKDGLNNSIRLGGNEYFLIADNYKNGIDSRHLGVFLLEDLYKNVRK